MFFAYIKKNVFYPALTTIVAVLLMLIFLFLFSPALDAYAYYKTISTQGISALGTTGSIQSDKNVFLIAGYASISFDNGDKFVYPQNVFMECEVEYDSTANLIDTAFKKTIHQPLGKNELAVSADFAKEHNIKVNDKVLLKNSGKIKEATVVYIFAPFFGMFKYNADSGGLVVLGHDSDFVTPDSSLGYMQYTTDESIIYTHFLTVAALKDEIIGIFALYYGLSVGLSLLVVGFAEFVLEKKYNKLLDYTILYKFGMTRRTLTLLLLIELLLKIFIPMICASVVAFFMGVLTGLIILNALYISAYFIFAAIAYVIAVITMFSIEKIRLNKVTK